MNKNDVEVLVILVKDDADYAYDLVVAWTDGPYPMAEVDKEHPGVTSWLRRYVRNERQGDEAKRLLWDWS